MRRTTKLAHPRRLGLLQFRDAWQRLSMTLLVMMLTAMTAWAETINVSYVKADGTTGNVDATVLTGSDEAVSLGAGWYVVNSDITYTGTIILTGDIAIILGDGKTMTVNTTGNGIDGSDRANDYANPSDLTIYGQTVQGGMLSVTASGEISEGICCQNFTVNSGTVNATGVNYGINADNGAITINNGAVNATSSNYGYGSGITASLGITISGGTVEAHSKCYGISCYVGDITISGGNVTAECTDYYSSIGIYNDNGNITISGGIVEATGENTGIYADSGDITIIDGDIEATGDGVGICVGSGITISGGTVSGTGGMSTYEGDITISGGKVTVTGNDICTLDGYIYLGWTNITDYITIKGVSAASTMVVDGKALVDNSGKIFSGNVSNPGDLGDVTLQPLTAVNLADNAKNATTIEKLNGVIDIDVTLQSHTLSKSGEWNTLCLPFSMTATQIAASDLAGATIKEIDCSAKGTELNNGTLTLKFTTAYDPTDAPDGSIVAGKPYIVKWNTTGDNISNPVFTGVTISSTAPTAVKSYDQKVTFVGQYSPFKIGDVSNGDDGNLNEILMLGSGSALGYSKNARELKCFRAHFYVPADGGSAGARAFVVDFGDEETTAIVSMEDGRRNTEDVNGIWYTLDGRRFDGKPTKKGVYIVNGKKIVIK